MSATARAFLAREKRKFDAIVLDAYSGAEMPAHLLTPAFFARVKAHLTPGGIALLNLIVGDDDDPLPHEIGSRMKTAWRNVRLLDRPDWTERNAILMAGRGEGPEAAASADEAAAARQGDCRDAEDDAVSSRAGSKRLSMLKKRSFTLSGHRTSVALEAEFWAVLEGCANRPGRASRPMSRRSTATGANGRWPAR